MEALILVAHADDETLGAGGTIRRLKKQGWDVNVVILSNGILDVRAKIQDNTPGAIAACAILGLDAPKFLGFPDQKFDQTPVADMANAVFALGLRPDLILTHSAYDLNLDHRITSDVAKIVARPRIKPVSLLECEIPNSNFWNGVPFAANFFVDITDELAIKIKAFACYENELQPFPHPCSEKGLRLLAEFHGMQAGFAFAEAFRIVRGYPDRLP